MIELPPYALVFYTGTRRCGKTTRLKDNLRQRGGNWIIYDVKREYGDFGIVVRSLREFEEAYLRQDCGRIVFQPRTIDLEEFDELCRQIYYRMKNVLLVVDELQLVAPKTKIGKWFKAIITVKGEDGVGVWGSTQLPQNAHNDFLDQVEAIYSQTQSGKASEHIVSRMGGEIKEEDLEHLPRYHTILWTDHLPPRDRIRYLPPVQG